MLVRAAWASSTLFAAKSQSSARWRHGRAFAGKRRSGVASIFFFLVIVVASVIFPIMLSVAARALANTGGTCVLLGGISLRSSAPYETNTSSPSSKSRIARTTMVPPGSIIQAAPGWAEWLNIEARRNKALPCRCTVRLSWTSDNSAVLKAFLSVIALSCTKESIVVGWVEAST
jgi:hypothetical protein